jgi:hypothetical protein
LLEQYPRLQKLFLPLCRCIKRGELHKFDLALQEGEDEFVKRRIYLTLERGRDIALRNLLRKVFIARGFEEAKEGEKPVRRTRVPVAEFAAAISLGSQEKIDNDEVECLLANMIYKVSQAQTCLPQEANPFSEVVRSLPPFSVSLADAFDRLPRTGMFVIALGPAAMLPCEAVVCLGIKAALPAIQNLPIGVNCCPRNESFLLIACCPGVYEGIHFSRSRHRGSQQDRGLPWYRCVRGMACVGPSQDQIIDRGLVNSWVSKF